MSDHAWDQIGSYGEIIEEARKARDVGEGMSSITYALCAIGLDLGEIANRIGSASECARCEAAQARVTELEADAETMYAVLRDSLAVSSARVTELEKVLLEISEKKCLNGDSTCDWPCVVCIARAALAALAKEDTDE